MNSERTGATWDSSAKFTPGGSLKQEDQQMNEAAHKAKGNAKVAALHMALKAINASDHNSAYTLP